MKNPNNHIASFLEKCDMIKMNRVSNDAIGFRLFPFSLKEKAKSWLLNSNVNSFTTWDGLPMHSDTSFPSRGDCQTPK